MTEIENKTEWILKNVEKLLLKKPFTRGCRTFSTNDTSDGNEVNITNVQRATLPDVMKTVISQAKFLKELDPHCHEVLFDGNIPSICVKLSDDLIQEIKFKKMAIPFQNRIREKQTLCLCGHPCEFTLRDSEPSEDEIKNFALFKEYWVDRNQDGMRTKAVYAQKGMGDAGLLYYFDRHKRIKSRLLTYEDGYVIISHNDANGDRIMECVYYKDALNVEHIDCYDDKYHYALSQGKDGWRCITEEHGFSEIPLVTKRGAVAWNDVQALIEAFEILYNIYLVIQKRHGWGILYIKGRIKENAQQIAGSIILNDTSIDGNGSAEFKSPPSPQGVLDTLQSLYEQIQIGSSTTFLLPKDVKSSGDISALAIMLTQSLDIEGATQGIIEWQNFADKMCRLFKEGLAKELVEKGINKTAVTDFKSMRISCKFKIWRPFNETEYNNMLISLKGAGIISKKTAIEKNTISTPDEELRVSREEVEVQEIEEVQKEIFKS